MTELVFLDLETTGLDPSRHQVWEAAWAIEDGDIQHGQVPHTADGADPAALILNHYYERFDPPTSMDQAVAALKLEGELKVALQGATIVGANPAFDAGFLRARWGEQPWHYRLLDIESFAMPILGYDRPQGLATISADLRERGFDIYQADHSARADVLALRDCYDALVSLSADK